MRLYGAFDKVEENGDGTLTVSGVASSEAVDSEGEMVLASAMREALPDYLKFGAVREMHQPTVAAGTALGAEVGDDGRTYFEALVVDPVACVKVRTKVYKGFSIGGKVPPGGRKKNDPKVIEHLQLVEISLVDRPANPEAVFQLVKMEAAMADPVAPVPAPEEPKPAEVVPPPAAPAELPPEKPADPAPGPVAKGMEAFDAGCAIDAIIQLQYLLSMEQGEDGPEAAAQLAALDAAIRALKTFVASEIQESDPEGVLMADKVAKAVAVFEALKAQPIAKAAKEIVVPTEIAESIKKGWGALMDGARAQLVSAAAPEEVAKLQGELTERDDALSKAAEALKGVIAERNGLVKQVADLEAKLAERKGVLRAVPVEKADDTGSGATPEEPKGEQTTTDLIKGAFRKPMGAPPAFRSR